MWTAVAPRGPVRTDDREHVPPAHVELPVAVEVPPFGPVVTRECMHDAFAQLVFEMEETLFPRGPVVVPACVTPADAMPSDPSASAAPRIVVDTMFM